MISSYSRYSSTEIVILIFAATTNAFSWISDSLNVTVCKSQTARLNWLYQLAPGETVHQLHWAKLPNTDIVVWDAQNFHFSDEGFKKLVTPFENGTLILKSCTNEHSGSYVARVIVTNVETGSRKFYAASAMLNVQDLIPPSYSSDVAPPDGSGVLNGNCKEFACFPHLHTLGEPPVEKLWKHDDEVFNISTRGSYTYLSLCEISDKGLYSCELTGEALQCLPPHHFLRSPVLFKLPLPKPMHENANMATVGLVVSVVVGVVLLLSAGVLLLIWWRKRKTQQQHYNTTIAEREKMSPEGQKLQDNVDPAI